MTSKTKTFGLSHKTEYAVGEQGGRYVLANSLVGGLYRLDWKLRCLTEGSDTEPNRVNVTLTSTNVTGVEENILTKDGQPWEANGIGSSTEGDFQFEVEDSSPLEIQLDPSGTIGGIFTAVLTKLD